MRLRLNLYFEIAAVPLGLTPIASVLTNPRAMGRIQATANVVIVIRGGDAASSEGMTGGNERSAMFRGSEGNHNE